MFRHFFQKDWPLWLAYSLTAIVTAVQDVLLGRQANGYTTYENFLIFKNSFTHLLAGQNPYAAYPAEQWDLFKYSPTFAVCMAPFSGLPDLVGLPVWHLLNALPLLASILFLPILDEKSRRNMAWFILPELVVTLQNNQSNGLTAALMLAACWSFETGKTRGAAAIAGGAFLKIFGLFAAAPGLFYPKKWAQAGWLAAWLLIFAAVPLAVISVEHLREAYDQWFALLQSDHEASVGLSVMGWLQTWFGLVLPKTWVLASGLALLGTSFLVAARRGNSPRTRALAWASVLLWVVIFNHRAESPTFVIALCGAAIWYFSGKKRRWETALLAAVFIFASVTPTDLFPRIWLNEWVKPYVLKAVPCIILWFSISYNLLFPATSPVPDEHQ